MGIAISRRKRRSMGLVSCGSGRIRGRGRRREDSRLQGIRAAGFQQVTGKNKAKTNRYLAANIAKERESSPGYRGWGRAKALTTRSTSLSAGSGHRGARRRTTAFTADYADRKS